MMAKQKREIKAGPNIPEHGHIEAFAIIVDLNQFTTMVSKAEETGDGIAQFVRDALSGAISEIETEGGEVVAFMGDAVLGIIPDGNNAVMACFGIAKDLDRMCSYISSAQSTGESNWEFAPGGPSLKIAIEYGMVDISTIESRFLGEHRLLVGSPINYAARISKAGEGNRCVIGPAAAKMEFSSYNLDGPHLISGKPGEPDYEYYFFSMDDIWIEGPRTPGKETFWD
jgi:class 3 adenylate cyclase